MVLSAEKYKQCEWSTHGRVTGEFHLVFKLSSLMVSRAYLAMCYLFVDQLVQERR